MPPPPPPPPPPVATPLIFVTNIKNCIKQREVDESPDFQKMDSTVPGYVKKSLYLGYIGGDESCGDIVL